MADWKPLIYSLIFIFLVGTIFTLVLAPILEIEDEVTESNWIQPFAIMSGVFIDIIALPFIILSYIVEGFTFAVFDIFSSSGDFSANITISGTGTHNSHTLNGVYELNTKTLFITSYQKQGTSDEIRIYFDDEDISEVYLVTKEHLPWYYFFASPLIVYNNTDLEFQNWTLLATSYDYESTASGSFVSSGEETTFEFTKALEDFIFELKTNVMTQIQAFGLLPTIIGIPIILLILIAILYSVIKLVPFT